MDTILTLVAVVVAAAALWAGRRAGRADGAADYERAMQARLADLHRKAAAAREALATLDDDALRSSLRAAGGRKSGV